MHTVKRTLAILAVAVGLLLVLPSAALGQEIPNDATAVAPQASLVLTEWTVLLITSLVIPAIVGIVTKNVASTTVKQVVWIILSAVAGVITTSTQLDGTAVISLTTVQYAALTAGISLLTYLGLYKPHDANAKLAPGLGVG